jgi:hypothetical protein
MGEINKLERETTGSSGSLQISLKETNTVIKGRAGWTAPGFESSLMNRIGWAPILYVRWSESYAKHPIFRGFWRRKDWVLHVPHALQDQHSVLRAIRSVDPVIPKLMEVEEHHL